MKPVQLFTSLESELKSGQSALAVIGLGYVGLPLAVEFAKHYRVIGFDTKASRIAELEAGHDSTRELGAEALRAAAGRLQLKHDAGALGSARVYIVTVPTPIDDYRRPDLEPLLAASRSVGRVLKPGDTVIYESTVYPGCTEDDCVPILESESGLKAAFGPESASEHAFFVGYSPERINPGDREHGIATITKVTSGSTPEAADFIDRLYASIVTAGTHKAPSIRVAEAAKVIENTQRDVNIALVNELAMLFSRLDLDTSDVLEAAATKWNFLPFKPGLVGGHCIGVDPYYLTHKAQQIGFHPQMILSGRRTNDGMGSFVAGELIKLMAKKSCYRAGARVLVLGLTFKENCPDLRNTRVIDIIRALQSYRLDVDVHDPWASPQQARDGFQLDLINAPEEQAYDAVILCVAHREFQQLADSSIRGWLKDNGVVYDLKSILPASIADARL